MENAGVFQFCDLCVRYRRHLRREPRDLEFAQDQIADRPDGSSRAEMRMLQNRTDSLHDCSPDRRYLELFRAGEPTRNHRRVERLPQGARVGWLDGQDLFLDIDSAYRTANAMAADGDGIVVGVQTLVKRLRESARRKSVDGQRGKLKVRRTIKGSRLEVLHLPADVLEHPIRKTGPIGPLTGAKDDVPNSHEMGGFYLVKRAH